MMKRLPLLTAALLLAGSALAATHESVCPPCQPFAEYDGSIVFQSRKVLPDAPNAAWFVFGVPEGSGNLDAIEAVYQVDCPARKATVLEYHLMDGHQQEIAQDTSMAGAIAKVQHSPEVKDIILKRMCPMQ